MSQSKQKEVSVSEEQINAIVNTLHTFKYSQTDLLDNVALPLAQWLKDSSFNLENTGYILSCIMNINNIQESIEEIFDPEFPPLYPKSDLVNFLTESEFEQLEKVITPPKKFEDFKVHINSDSFIKVDFRNCTVKFVREVMTRNGDTDYKETPVIEAVPRKVTVYDSDFIEQPRCFKVVWQSKYSNRLFSTNGDGIGATIPDIEKVLVSSGYTHNKKLLGDVVSATFNGMIANGYAEIKDTIDNKGVYFNENENKIVCVKVDTSEPTDEEILQAISTLNELYLAFEKESETFATVIKWSLVSIFSYAIKQTGRWLPWLYLVGAGGSGKTTMANIGMYFYSEPNDVNNLGGGSFNTDFRIGDKISQDCCIRVVNEPAPTFKNRGTIDIVKNSVELKVARRVQGKVYHAFSPVCFTANNFIPEMDSLYRRLFIIEFEYNQRKSKTSKKRFENQFNVFSPSVSCLNDLKVFGRLAIREIITDTSLLYDEWQDLADTLIERIYGQVNQPVPDWLKQWSKDKDLSDLDNTQIENIRSILIEEMYNARKRITLRGDYGQIEEFSLDGDEVSSNSKEFESLYWDLINERVFSWCLPHKPRGKPKSVFLNQGFKQLIGKHIDETGTLKSLGQLLHWEYKKVNFKNSQSRGLLVPFEEFMSFIYPSVENDELE